MQIETVSLLEVIAAARARHASLVPESSGYVMLALGRAMAGVPIRLDLERLLLTTEGAVSVAGPKEAISSAAALSSLGKLMVELLELSNGSLPALRTIAERTTGETSIDAFFEAIARALIPINHTAAKRTLARLARETLKAHQEGNLARPSLVLDGGRISATSRTSAPEKVRKTDQKSKSARSRSSSPPSDDSSPSPGRSSASLTPTFLDTDVGNKHEQMSFREEVMRAVVGYVAKDRSSMGAVPPPKKATPEAAAHPGNESNDKRQSARDTAAAAAKPVPAAAKDAATCSALELLDKVEAAAVQKLDSDRPVKGRGPGRSKRPSLRPFKRVLSQEDVSEPLIASTVESLLAGFELASDGIVSLEHAAESLGALGRTQMTPSPGPLVSDEAVLAADSASSQPGDRTAVNFATPLPTPSSSVEVELSPVPDVSRASATPAGHSLDSEHSSSPPPFRDRVARSRRPGRLALGAVAILGASLAAVAIVRPEFFGRLRYTAAQVAVCQAELTLKNLPETHEVLLRIGIAPVTTHALPRGVRLELVATAPDHEARRFILEADTDWRVATGGLTLDAKLEAGGLRTWPVAPAGAVGGFGPPGQLNLTSSPSGAELWLVLTAGAGERAKVALPCQERAHLLVVDPADAVHARRLDLEPELLKAAAQNGDGEVLVQP